MKKVFKNSVSLLLAAIMIFGMLPVFNAAAKTSGNLTYEVQNGKVTITGCKESASGKLTIPSKIGGYPVTKIGQEAFSGCSELTSVKIPDGVTSIGENAFSGCANLKSVTVPDSVKSIGKFAFFCCLNLTDIKIPNKVKIINEGVFYYCDSLKTINIPKGVTKIDDYAFEGCISLDNVTIPNGVKTIGDAAFSECSIKSITIPDSVTSIGEWAFSYCENLTSVKIGKGVKKIERRTFQFCTSLKSVTIPEGVESIGEQAFEFCGCLKSIRIPKSVTKIEKEAFGYDRDENKEKVAGFTIYGYKDSAAQKYAKNNGFKFVAFGKIGSVTLSNDTFTYDGKAKQPTVTVKDSKGNTLKNGTDYTVKYSSGRKNVGKYTVTVTFKGKYSGTKKLTFKIKPRSTSISKLTAGKNKFTATWKKQTTQVSGYQLQYSTSSSMKNAKLKPLSDTSKNSLTVTGLKASTKYYVRVRTYKNVKIDGKTYKYFSAWSSVKSVKTK